MSISEKAAEESPKLSEGATEEVLKPTAGSETATSEASESAATASAATEEATPAKKRKKAAVQLDEEGNPVKKTRAPYVYTEKRKQAFELCRLRRAETIAKRKAVEQVETAAKKEVRSNIRTLRNLMEVVDPKLISNTLQHTLRSVQSSQTMPSTAPDLTVSSTAPNLPPLPGPLPELSEVPAPMPAASTPMEEETPTASPPPPVTTAPASDPPADPRLLRVTERPIKRKQSPPRRGTGAGNHEPYEGDPGYVEANYEPREEAVDIDAMTDEQLTEFMARARANAEARGLFNVRRMTNKMARPSHATMFLDHSYMHAQTSHPSMLGSRMQSQQQPPSAGGAGAGASDFLWL